MVVVLIVVAAVELVDVVVKDGKEGDAAVVKAAGMVICVRDVSSSSSYGTHKGEGGVMIVFKGVIVIGAVGVVGSVGVAIIVMVVRAEFEEERTDSKGSLILVDGIVVVDDDDDDGHGDGNDVQTICEAGAEGESEEESSSSLSTSTATI